MNRRDALTGLGVAFAVASSPVFASTAPSGARWITLGTSGGPQMQAERAQISNALVVGDAIYLFDVGNDVQRQLARAGLPERNVRGVFLSHHHLDHNADLGPVMMTHWLFGRDVLPVYGPAGTRKLVSGIAAANEATELASFPTAGPGKPPVSDTVSAQDLPDDISAPMEVYRDDHVVVSAISVDHYQVQPSIPLEVMPRAVAYRVEAAGRAFVYSGDSGPSNGLERLARKADVLITEVVDLDAIAARISRTMPNAPEAIRNNVVTGMRVNHLTADEVGKLAAAAGVGTVVLTHFVPIPEQMKSPASLIKAVRRHYSGRVVLARDLDSFS